MSYFVYQRGGANELGKVLTPLVIAAASHLEHRIEEMRADRDFSAKLFELEREYATLFMVSKYLNEVNEFHASVDLMAIIYKNTSVI